MVRWAAIVGIFVLAVAFGGCGGREHARVQERQPPRIPRALAGPLAVDSDAVARSLERGDACSASGQLARLEQAARQAVATGRMPRPFRHKVLLAVATLKAQAPPCVAPAQEGEGGDQPPPAEGKHGERGKGHGKGHGRGRDH